MKKEVKEGLNVKRTYGVEIEGYNVPQHRIYSTLRNNGIHGWTVKSDGSISGAGVVSPFEVVSPPLSGLEGLEEIRKVCNILDDLGAMVNKSCGLHVHHDAADLTVQHLVNLNRLYQQSEREIDRLVPPSRRGSVNRYCQSNSLTDEDALARGKENLNRWIGTRYRKVNFLSLLRHNTVEFRHHSGTIDAKKIINWVRFTQLLVERSKRKVNKTSHSYTWFDVKQAAGIIEAKRRNEEWAFTLESHLEGRRDSFRELEALAR